MSLSLADRPNALNWPALMAVVGRLGIGALFLDSGFEKLLAPAATLQYIEASGLPFPWLALVTAIAVEIGGSLALLAGWKVRWIAITLAMFTVAAAIGFHANFAEPGQSVHFLKNLAIAGGLVHVAIAGGGQYSLDSRRGK